MAQLRTAVLALLFAALALTATACANTPTVRVCDPCGCRCVAAPILTGCGAVPRPAEGSDAEATNGDTPALGKAVLDPTSDLAVEQVLATKRIRGLAWDAVNLDTAATYLRTVAGLNVTLSPKVREEKFEDIVYNLALSDVTALSVLELITEPFGLRWEPREGAVWILTCEEIGGPKRLRYFDVKDLTFTVFVEAMAQPCLCQTAIGSVVARRCSRRFARRSTRSIGREGRSRWRRATAS